MASRLGHLRDQVLSSRSLSLSSRDHGASTTAPGHHLDCRSSTFPGTDSLRLSLPSTHSGIRSLLNQGLPRPVGSAFRVFVYPLSVFFLLNPLEPFFRPKRSWDSPLQSFTPFEEPCLSRSLLLSCPFAHWMPPASQCCSDFRALLPSKSRPRGSVITPIPEPLLSWGFPALGCFTHPTLASHETLPLSHFHSLPRKPARCPRVLLPEERLSSEKRAYPSAVSSLFSLSNLFNESIC